MHPQSEIFERLYKEIQQSVSDSSRLVITDAGSDHLTLQVGCGENSFVSISLDDATGPTFSATYPLLHSDRKGFATIIDNNSANLRSEGLVWIIRKVFRFGFVAP